MRRVPAVDDQLGAGDESGLVRGEVEDPVGDVVRFALAAERVIGEESAVAAA